MKPEWYQRVNYAFRFFSDRGIRHEVALAKKNNPAGAGRDAAIEKIERKYLLPGGTIRRWSLSVGGGDYWK